MQAASSPARHRPAIVANWAIWELPGWLQRFVLATVLAYTAVLVVAAAGCRRTCMTSRYSASCWPSAWPRWSSPGVPGSPPG